MKKVKTNLRRVAVGDFIIKARNIQTHLNDPMFSSIVPTAGEVMPLVDEMESLQAQIQDGYTGLIEQRNEKRQTINTLLFRQCAAVNSLAGGDLTILQASGFELCKVPETRPVPERVKVVNVTNGFNNGEVNISYSATKHSDSFFVQMRLPEGDWETVRTTSKRKLMLENLPVKEYAYFRVAAFNTAGMGEWSVPVRVLVGR